MFRPLRLVLLAILLLPCAAFAGASVADPGFAPDVNGDIRCTAVRPNGEVYIGGTFTFVNGTARSFLTRLNPDGSSASFSAVLDGAVSAIALMPDGKLVIGGDFTMVNGKTRARLARLFFDGALDESFQADADASVYGLAVQQDGSVLASGSFQNVDGRMHRRLVRVGPSGSVDDGFNASADDDVYTIALQDNDHILIGGSFFNVNGAFRSRIARLDNNGVLDTGFDPGALGFVFSIAVQSDGQFIIGGDFGVKRVDSSGAVDSGFSPNPDNAVRGIAVQADGKILLAGDFQNLGTDARQGLALLNPDGSLVTTFDAAANGPVRGIALQANGKIIVTGGFGSIGGQTRVFIGRLFGNPAPQALTAPSTITARWTRGGGGPELSSAFFNQSSDGGISWTGLGYGTRIAGGWEITGVNLSTVDTISVTGRTVGGKGNGSSGLVETVTTIPVLDPDFLPNPDGGVNSVAVQPDGMILVGGSFLNFGGSPHASLARVGVDGVVDTAFVGTTDGSVSSIAVLSDGKILIGGMFTKVDGTNQLGLARLNADGTLDSSFTTAVDAAVNCLLVQPDGKIVVGGVFTTLGGASHNLLGRLNADGALDTGFNVSITGVAVHSLARQPDGKILFGGDFTQVGITVRHDLGRVSEGGVLDAFDADVNGIVRAIAVHPDNGEITIGGDFNTVGGVSRPFFARVLTSGGLKDGFDLFPDGVVRSIVAQADGKLIIAGEFGNVAGIVRHKVARLNADDTLDGGFDPNADGDAFASQMLDGRILLGGFFTNVHSAPRAQLALLNNIAAKQTLSPLNPTTVRWVRDGSAPEAQDVSFELSTDNGTNWQPLGFASHVARGDGFSGLWDLGSLATLPASGKLRARAHTFGGFGNASASLIEAVADFFIPQTAAATVITSTGATLNADVATNSFTADLRFEYSTDSNLAGSQTTLALEFGSSGIHSIAVTGLQPNTTYFYRAIVFDTAGPVYGPILSFTTAPAVFVPVVNTGGDVTGAEQGTKFFEFGAPAIDGGVIGGAATVKKTGSKAAATIIYGDTDSSVIASTGLPDGAGSTFVALGDPVFAGEALGFTGIAKVNPQQIPAWMFDVRLGIADITRATTLRPGAKLAALYSRLSKATSIKQLARQGGDAAGVNGGTFTKIPSFGLPRRRAGLIYTGKLRRGGEVNAKNDSGIWRETAVAGESEKLVQTGDKPDGTNAIKTLQLMIPVANATDQRRSFAPDGGVAAAATFDTGEAGIVRVSAAGAVDVPVTRSTNVPDEVNATFRQFDAPATAGGGLLAFQAALRAAATGQQPPPTRAIFSNRSGVLRSVARVGGSLPGNNQQRFARLGQPLMGQSGLIGFLATLAGKGVAPRNKVALIQDRAGTQSVIARLGDPAAEFGEGPVYQKFQSVVVTDTAAGHMVFTGTTTGKNLTKRNRQGLWAISATGTVKLLLRSDQPVKIGDDMPTVRVFQALVAKPASQGQGRSTDEAGFVSVKVTLSDGRKGVLSIPLPQ